MASIGDKAIFGGRTFRFQTANGVDAWRPWSIWGGIFVDTSLALAKAQVDVSGAVDERMIVLNDTTAGTVHIFALKTTGYGSDFDDSFEQVWDTDDIFVTSETIGAVLNTIDIDQLSGMTSNSATVEGAISDTAGHVTVLNGITAGDLSDAVAKSHDQNTDTGTTQTSYKIGEGTTNKEATLDSDNVTANILIDLKRVEDNLDGASNAMPIVAKDKTTALAEAVIGQTIFITDIDVDGFVLTYDGTDFISGVYFMQDASNTIATAPSVGDVFSHLGSFWKVIDATTDEEVFVITQQKPVTNHAATGNITADETKGGITTNTGATAAVQLTMLSDAESEGAHLTIVKTDDDTLTIRDSSPSVIIANTTTETNVQIELQFVNGVWQIGTFTGTWA